MQSISMMIGQLFILFVLLFAQQVVDADTSRPIIGILTLDSKVENELGVGTFPASYVKFVESGGARVVPIRFEQSKSDLLKLLDQLNGALLTGGKGKPSPNSSYFEAVQTIVDYTLRVNAAGDHFPLWGTCLGFESIIATVANDYQILGNFNAYNIRLPVQWFPDAFGGRMFPKDRPDARRTFDDLRDDNSINLHSYGISPESFAPNSRLSSVLRALGTSFDRNGRSFVAAAEGISVPIFITQFHPEMPKFEWTTKWDIPRSRESRDISDYLADVFIDSARKSSASRGFQTKKQELMSIIDNYNPVLQNGLDEPQNYVFHQVELPEHKIAVV